MGNIVSLCQENTTAAGWELFLPLPGKFSGVVGGREGGSVHKGGMCVCGGGGGGRVGRVFMGNTVILCQKISTVAGWRSLVRRAVHFSVLLCVCVWTPNCTPVSLVPRSPRARKGAAPPQKGCRRRGACPTTPTSWTPSAPSRSESSGLAHGYVLLDLHLFLSSKSSAGFFHTGFFQGRSESMEGR